MQQSAFSRHLGLIGLLVCAVCALLSRLAVFAPCPFIVVIPTALVGMVFCVASLFTRRRFSGVLGLLVMVTCIGNWGAFAGQLTVTVRRPLQKYDVSLAQYTQLLWDSQEMVNAVEAHRKRRGALPPSLAIPALDPQFTTDPWNRSYTYTIDESSPWGYKIVTCGEDGQLQTTDDIDVLAMDRNDMFSIGQPPR